MFEPRTTLTYDEAFARARKERSAAFRELFGFGKPAEPRASGWSLLRRASHA